MKWIIGKSLFSLLGVFDAKISKNSEIVCHYLDKMTIEIFNLFVWIRIVQYGKPHSTINEHILNVFNEGELKEEGSIRKIGISDFSTLQVKAHEHFGGKKEAEG